MNKPAIRKFSISEIHTAKLTIDQMKKKNLVVDRRRNSLNQKNVEFLKQLGLPAQYTGPTPKLKERSKAPTRSKDKSSTMPKSKQGPSKPSPKEAKPSAKKEKSAPKPDKTPQKPVEKKVVEKKPAEKKVVEEKPAEKKVVEEKPVEKKAVEKKPAEKNIVEEKPVEKPVVEEKPVEKKAVEKKPVPSADGTMVEPNVLEAVAALFETTPLFANKNDLMEVLETKVAGLSKLTATKIFDILKEKNIIEYSRTAPRGYSLKLE